MITALRHRVEELRVGLMFLTRLPMGHVARQIPLAQTAWSWPLAGLLTGGTLALGQSAALAIGLPTATAVICGMILSLLVTGGLHEDGLADLADGVGGGADRARRLEIMRDSRIGSYGVLALVCILALQVSLWFAASAIWAQALCAAVLSRAALPALMALFPQARADGLGRNAARDMDTTVQVAALAIGLGLSVCLLGVTGVSAAVPCFMVQAGLCLWAKRMLGGITGDVLGAAQVLGLTTALAWMVAWQ